MNQDLSEILQSERLQSLYDLKKQTKFEENQRLEVHVTGSSQQEFHVTPSYCAAIWRLPGKSEIYSETKHAAVRLKYKV